MATTTPLDVLLGTLSAGTHTISVVVVENDAEVTLAGVTASLVIECAVTDSTASSDSGNGRFAGSVTDGVSGTDSSTAQVISPAFASATDSTTSSDSVSCVFTVAAAISTPFLLAASFLVAVLADTATADTTTQTDAVAISRLSTASDGTSAADSVAIALTAATTDGTTEANIVGVAVGAYSSAADSTTSSDATDETLRLVSSGSDSTTQTDSVSVEQTFPATVEVSDSTASADSTRIVAAVGHADSTSSADEALAYVGQLAQAVDSTASSDASTASVATAPPPDEEPIVIVATPVPLGILATESWRGVLADRVTFGFMHGGTMSTKYAYQGTDLVIEFPRARDAKGASVDVTGATLACSVRVGGLDYAATATSVSPADGTSRAEFSAAMTATWPANVSGRYDAVLTLANGQRFVNGTGDFKTRDPITPTP